jgi:hypothetical protein
MEHSMTQFRQTSSDATPFSSGYVGFVAYLHDAEIGPTALSPKLFSDTLSLDLQSLADQAHVHRSTLLHAPGSVTVQRFLREVLRVLRAAFDLSGDIQRAAFWYRNEPLPTFGYETAERLVSEGRTDDVLCFVESLEAGAAG